MLGLVVGTGLLVIGVLLGFFLGRRAGAASQVVDRQQFLGFLQNLSHWTSEFAGDVSKYQTQLTSISQRVQGGNEAPREEILQLLTQIMQANQQLQNRLDTAEERLESQTHQIADYLTEARTDGLTGLTNRRAFDQTLDELYVQWQSKSQAFTLGLVDIDHFKKINDTYGHPAGDTVLKKVSETMRNEFRDAVCVARYGGEEFAILCMMPLEEAADCVDRLRSAISRTEFRHEDTIIPVTLSGGVARIEGDDKIGKLVRRSDEALYAAKLGGRNRIYLHDGSICRLVTKVPPATVRDLRSEAVPNMAQQDSTVRLQERLKRIVEEESRRV
ncbi:MAG: GGDEF domain-containing protein [Pirellulaceae bacterium]|nr:GGDEF domain-containing protein [Pirellulaceae bacterium]